MQVVFSGKRKHRRLFPYAELIRIERVEREGNLFTAFAQLDKEEAIAALKKGYDAIETRFLRERPRIEKALQSLITQSCSVRSLIPINLYALDAKYQRMLEALGSTLDSGNLTTIDDLARRVAQARGQARLYVTTSGDTSDTIQKGVKGVFVEYLAGLGCQMVARRSLQAQRSRSN